MEKAPSSPVWKKYGLSTTCTQPSIQPWASQSTFTVPGRFRTLVTFWSCSGSATLNAVRFP